MGWKKTTSASDDTGGRGRELGAGLYVYGVVPGHTTPDVFADVPAVDPSRDVFLIEADGVAAVASGVSLGEFGDAAIEANLRDPEWLAAKVRAHDAVLAAAVGRVAVIPFRFGTIYRGEEHVRALLSARRDFVETLRRVDGTVELGVKAFVDIGVVRARVAAERGVPGDEPQTGAAYMQRRHLERESERVARELAARCAADAHERLVAAAEDATSNPVYADDAEESERTMILNGAYLVPVGSVNTFRETLAELEQRYAADGATFELTGPWPPYNFVGGGEKAE